VSEGVLIPTVVEQTEDGERAFDIFSSLMRLRIVFCSGEIGPAMSKVLVAQLLHLGAEDVKEPIKMYIDSPGGSVTAGMSILDTMNIIASPVHTYSMGQSASMGSLLLSAGQKGHRYGLPNTQVMIHQPSGGFSGQVTDIEIHTKLILEMKERLTKILAKNCDQEYRDVLLACERDNYMTAKQALDFGIIDHIL